MSDLGYTGFKFKYNLAGRTSGIQRSFIVASNVTLTVGDMVALSSGFIDLAGAAAKIMGVVVGIVDKNGIDLLNSKQSFGATSSNTYGSAKTFHTADDNTTVDQVKAIVDVDPFSVWSGCTDNDNTDAESRLAGCFTDIISASDQVDDDSAATTQGQLFIWGADPETGAEHSNLYSIAQHQLWGWTIV